jgi:DNA-binding transcriptional LysR family regulator
MIWRQLAQKLERVAPGVDLHAVPYTPEGTYSDLREASADLAIGPISHHDNSLRSIFLFQGGYQVAMRADHPLAGKPLSMEDFINARHLLVTMSGEAHGLVDNYLDLKGLNRRSAGKKYIPTAEFLSRMATLFRFRKRVERLCGQKQQPRRELRRDRYMERELPAARSAKLAKAGRAKAARTATSAVAVAVILRMVILLRIIDWFVRDWKFRGYFRIR